LWRGPPLAEVAFDDFAQAEIRRLEELHLVALETRIEADLQLGRHVDVIGELDGLLAEHPTREHLAGQLMLALYRTGRQADALETYQRTRAHLASELGLEPGPALKSLQTDILKQAAGLKAPTPGKGSPAALADVDVGVPDSDRSPDSPTPEGVGGGGPEVPAGTVTFVFADIEGSTDLLRDLGAETFSRELGRHRVRIREAGVAHHAGAFGTEGDAVFMVFARASDALATAEDLQTTFADEPVGLRVGIHTGEPLLVDNDYVGLDVRKAARICAAAHGGQTLLSRSTRELVDADVRDLGEHHLKDFPAPERLFQLGSGVFPMLATATASNLPPEPGELLGRDRDVEEISWLLRDPHNRLITLVGPGGVGKTRLALAIAYAVEALFADGVWWVELAGVARPDDVAPTVARALPVVRTPGESTEAAIKRYLAHRRLLLVVDNFEHVLEAAELVAEFLEAGDGVTVLVTSREPLDLTAERRAYVAPLAVPQSSPDLSVSEVEEAPATALFLGAARRRGSELTVTPANAALIAETCSRLDGLPLALELAAARTEFLGVDDLAARVASLIDGASGPRDAPARQRTLSATIDWSYRLLDPPQREAFARFGVFAGGAAIYAAHEITGASLDVLQALVVKNLLVRRASGDLATRLVMLETVRDYATRRFAEDPEQATVCRRHFDAYLRVVERAVPRLSTYAEIEALAAIDADVDNIRSALRWGLDNHPVGALRLAGMLGEYWWISSNGDGLAWLEAALQSAGDAAPPQDRALAHLMRAKQLVLRRHLHDAPVQPTMTALELYEQCGDYRGMSAACYWLVYHWRQFTDLPHARQLADDACRYARLAGDDRLLGQALTRRIQLLDAKERLAALKEAAPLLTKTGNYFHLAIAYNVAAWYSLKEGRDHEARSLIDGAVAACEKGGPPHSRMICRGTLGQACLFIGDLEGARAAFGDVLALSAKHGVRHGMDDLFPHLAGLSAAEGRAERAALLLGAAHALGYPGADEPPMDQRLETEFFARARKDIGDAAWEQAERRGEMLSYDEALVYARQAAGIDGAGAESQALTSPPLHRS
jgi:predicted ATPase/class 3 adenylate cyclase